MLEGAFLFRRGDRVEYVSEENRGLDGELGTIEKIVGSRVYVRFDNRSISAGEPLSCGAKSIVLLERTSEERYEHDAEQALRAAPPQSS